MDPPNAPVTPRTFFFRLYNVVVNADAIAVTSEKHAASDAAGVLNSPVTVLVEGKREEQLRLVP